MSLDVQALKAAQQAATPLPWLNEHKGRVHTSPHEVGLTTVCRAGLHDKNQRDAAYIVAACNALPELLDLLERCAVWVKLAHMRSAWVHEQDASEEVLADLRSAGLMKDKG